MISDADIKTLVEFYLDIHLAYSLEYYPEYDDGLVRRVEEYLRESRRDTQE